ncbi:MAG: serine protease [Planctomycetaceae bacterium]|nr:serine protease [Planctomycetaceae bacterium]
MTHSSTLSVGQCRHVLALLVATALWSSIAPQAWAQSVGLPLPRLLTTMPMGGQVGKQVEVTITGDNIDDAEELTFSDPRITAKRAVDAAGQPIADKYLVSIAADCPVGLHEARLMTRLGISSSRVFSVGDLPEATRTTPNTTVATAMPVAVNSICNAVMTARAVDHYAFEAKQGQRVLVDCSSRGIDSKLDAVVIVADAQGNDLQVERQNGFVDFTAPANGRYMVKVHEMTFKGGPAFFYRLSLRELPSGTPVVRMPSTKSVSSASWPPVGLAAQAALTEREPNNDRAQVQKISLPCDIAGSFYPAADVDTFEFSAKKGEEWWVEVASERFGLPTDASIIVQHVSGSGDNEQLTDVAEFTDIPSPVKVSSNGYAYDGPPYNAGSPDILAKLVIQQDGVHRLQVSDQFGGTRSDPRNIYRLVIRKASPDFSLVAWGLHMELRNGDRNALSKPLALRGGATMSLEVVVVRRDGFEGDIELAMTDLPPGVTAEGLKIPAGKTRGIMVVTASEKAPRGIASAKLVGRATINGATVERPCRLASMAWPVVDSSAEIPYPRLLADVPVSVSGYEFAPLTVSTAKKDLVEVAANAKVTIPLTLTRRSEFSGATLKLRVFGAGFEGAPAFDVPLTADKAEATLDLATLKPTPGDYKIAFYGSAVAKYRYNPEAVARAEEAHRTATLELQAIEAEAKRLAEVAKTVTPAGKAEADNAVAMILAKQKAATAKITAAAALVVKTTEAAKPKDIVDIIVSDPIAIRVKPVETK